MMWDVREVRDSLPKAHGRQSPNPLYPAIPRVGSVPATGMVQFPGPAPGFVPMLPGHMPTYDIGQHHERPRQYHHRHVPSDSPHYFPQPQYPPRTRAHSFSHPLPPPPPPPKPTTPIPKDRHRSHHRSHHASHHTSHHTSHHPAVLHRPSHSNIQNLNVSHSNGQNVNALYSYSHPQQPVAAPGFRYSRCTGRKKALCIGINYKGQPHELRGCVNDANNVRRFLIKYCGYKDSDIRLLTDDSKDPRYIPTRKNMLDAMRWLVRSARPDDSLFFHYSGHGGQTPDLDGDELDGLDEVIYPVDFKKNGHIIDDEMHMIMVKPLPAGCRLTAVFDACHSGTVLDLPYVYSPHGRLKGVQVNPRMLKRLSSPADVISWSGCEDSQTSSDTFADGKAVGAMSYAFTQALKMRPKQSYQELLRSIRLILQPRYSQKPQLGSSHHIDTSLQFVI